MTASGGHHWLNGEAPSDMHVTSVFLMATGPQRESLFQVLSTEHFPLILVGMLGSQSRVSNQQPPLSPGYLLEMQSRLLPLPRPKTETLGLRPSNPFL